MYTLTINQAFEKFANSEFVLTEQTGEHKFSFTNKTVQIPGSSDDLVCDEVLHNISRTHFGQKEGNSKRVTAKKEEIMKMITETEVEEVEPEIEPEIEEVEVKPVLKPFGMPTNSAAQIVEKLKKSNEVESHISESDIPDEDEPKVVLNHVKNDRDTKFAIMDEVIKNHPNATIDELIKESEILYGDQLYIPRSMKYWMGKRLLAAGIKVQNRGNKPKSEKTNKLVEESVKNLFPDYESFEITEAVYKVRVSLNNGETITIDVALNSVALGIK